MTCVPFLATVNNDAVDIFVHISPYTFLLGTYLVGESQITEDNYGQL